MATANTQSLEELYTEDETAWLDAMAELVRLNRLDALDYANLAEYLTDMAAQRSPGSTKPIGHDADAPAQVGAPAGQAIGQLADDTLERE